MIEIKDYLPKIKKDIFPWHIVGKWEAAFNNNAFRGFVLPEYFRQRVEEIYSEQERVWVEDIIQVREERREGE